MLEQRIVGKRPDDVDSLALASDDGRPDDRLFLVAKESILAGMRVERRHGDPRRLSAGQGPHRLVSQADLGQESLRCQEIEDSLESDMQRHVDHAQPGPVAATAGAGDSSFEAIGLQVKHHRVIGRAATFRQDLGMARVVDTALMEGHAC